MNIRIPVTHTGFFAFIAHKYGRIRPPHPKFPSLVFFYNYARHNTLLHYLLLKNMNIPAGNRDYRLNQHQHIHFVVNLYPRISPHFPGPAAPPGMEKIRSLSETLQHFLLSQSVTDRFYQAVFPQLYTRGHQPRPPGAGAAGVYPGKSPQHTASESYPTPPVFTEPSHIDHVYRHRELLKKIRTAANRYYISRERQPQTLMVKKTASLIKPVGDLLITQSLESSQPGTVPHDNAFSPGADELSHREYPHSPIFMAAPHDAVGLDLGRMKIMHSISQFNWRGLIYQARPQAIHPLGLMNQTPTIGFILRRAANFTAGEFYPSQSVYNGESRFPSLTSPVISNITRKYTASPGDIPTFFPTAPVPDLYYSGPIKGMGSDVEESRAVTGPIKGVKSLEQAGPAPVKLSGPEQPGVFKKPAVDLDRLTHQVYRMLEKKIRIERERRGW